MTVSFCWPGIFFEQTNYMMIDPRKLPNNTTAAPTELILATPPSSDLLLVFSWLALSVQSVELEQVFVPPPGQFQMQKINQGNYCVSFSLA